MDSKKLRIGNITVSAAAAVAMFTLCASNIEKPPVDVYGPPPPEKVRPSHQSQEVMERLRIMKPEVSAIISKYARAKAPDIQEEMTLKRDLRISNKNKNKLKLNLETAYDIRISAADWKETVTVGDVMKIVVKELEKQLVHY